MNENFSDLVSLAEKINVEISSMKNWFDEIPQLVAIGDGIRFIRVNVMFEKVLGWKPEEIIKMQWVSLMHPDDIGPTFNVVAPDGHPLLNFFNRYKKKNGDYIWLQWNVSPLTGGETYICATPHFEDSPLRDWLKQLENERHNNPQKGDYGHIIEAYQAFDLISNSNSKDKGIK